MNNKLLTSDIGGTHSRFCLFEHFEPIEQVVYQSKNFRSFKEVLTLLFEEHPTFSTCDKACFSFAGMGDSNFFKVTNIPWSIDRKEVCSCFGIHELSFLNDLQAAAYGLQLLPEESFYPLQEGTKSLGTLALISPGTGLGESFLTEEQVAYHTEGGHADFAPCTKTQVELWQFLKKQFGRVSCEHVLSGPGIVQIYNFLKEKGGSSTVLEEGIDKGVAIRKGALEKKDPLCLQTLQLFIECLAQEASNLALHTLARQGVCIGGGIAPHLIPLLKEESFLNTFCDKDPLKPFLQSIPIRLVLDERASLFGCAWFCLYGHH